MTLQELAKKYVDLRHDYNFTIKNYRGIKYAYKTLGDISEEINEHYTAIMYILGDGKNVPLDHDTILKRSGHRLLIMKGKHDVTETI